MTKFFRYLILVVFILASCGGQPSPSAIANDAATPQPTQVQTVEFDSNPSSKTQIVVTSPQDSGPGTLRQALEGAKAGASITFDANIFPPDNPAIITLLSPLPRLDEGRIILDASEAGVIIDGSQAVGDWTPGLEISSSENIIRGLQIKSFSGSGILVDASAGQNRIGGDRARGKSLVGQGNLIKNCVVGIALRGPENQIIGNLIGTDAGGQQRWGNILAGISLQENANRNVIGPGNIIAYNGTSGSGGGVDIQSTDIVGNRITQNDIHDNADPAIFYDFAEGRRPAQLPQPPQILDYNLLQGEASGLACAGCTVEFFTTLPAGGEFYEGSTVAGMGGEFLFEKDGGFQGGQLKATSYAENQNNSEFSAYVYSASFSIRLQNFNAHPRLALSAVKFQDAQFNGIGITQYLSCEDEETAASYLFDAERMGYKWVRVSLDQFDWSDVKRTGQYSELKVSACQEKAIDLLHQNGVQILYDLVYWDPEIQLNDGYTRFHTNEEIERYKEYVRYIVGHFKGKIQWYSLLNEPNVPSGQGAVLAGDYINLTRQVIPIIREVDPAAKIVIGELTPLNESGAMNYMRTILRSDIPGMVDGIAWHGGAGNSMEYQPDYYRSYPRWVKEIVTTAQAKGFTGQFFSTELQWRTVKTASPSTPRWVYSNSTVGKYYARAIVSQRAKNFLVTVGFQDYETIPEAVRVISSLTNLLGGTQPTNVEVKVKKPPQDLRTAAFRLPDGSTLLAFWRDVTAKDDDPGAPNTVKIFGAKAGTLIGINPLYAFQQELNFSQEKDAVVVENFLIQEYPTFIRISTP